MKPLIEKGIPVPKSEPTCGAGNATFIELASLEYNGKTKTGDCAVYPDSDEMRKELVYSAKGRYNRAASGLFAGMKFAHRYEEREGKSVIVIQRVK